jgi:hypothetical protein
VALVLAAGAVAMLLVLRRVLRRLIGGRRQPAPETENPAMPDR